jgi:hypothetical protein
MSTSEPGRKARTLLVMTVRPPLTLPVMVPVTSVPSFSAFSRSSRRRCAWRVARQAGFAETVFELLDGDLDEIADLDFEFAAIAAGILRRSM